MSPLTNSSPQQGQKACRLFPVHWLHSSQRPEGQARTMQMSWGWDLAKGPPKGGRGAGSEGIAKEGAYIAQHLLCSQAANYSLLPKTQYQSAKAPSEYMPESESTCRLVVPESLAFGMILRLSEFVVCPLCTSPIQGRQC